MLVLCVQIRYNEENLEFRTQIISWMLFSLAFKVLYVMMNWYLCLKQAAYTVSSRNCDKLIRVYAK
jgi:hypothetical protein